MSKWSYDLVREVVGLEEGDERIVKLHNGRFGMGDSIAEQIKALVEGTIIQGQVVVEKDDEWTDEEFEGACVNLEQNVKRRGRAQNVAIIARTFEPENPNVRYVHFGLKR